jgi:hypothetical protein
MLCRPLAQRPTAFGLSQGEATTLRVRIALTLPDEDMSRVQASVESHASGDRDLSEEARALVEATVNSLLETLRALGGESSAAGMRVDVACEIGVRQPDSPPHL